MKYPRLLITALLAVPVTLLFGQAGGVTVSTSAAAARQYRGVKITESEINEFRAAARAGDVNALSEIAGKAPTWTPVIPRPPNDAVARAERALQLAEVALEAAKSVVGSNPGAAGRTAQAVTEIVIGSYPVTSITISLPQNPDARALTGQDLTLPPGDYELAMARVGDLAAKAAWIASRAAVIAASPGVAAEVAANTTAMASNPAVVAANPSAVARVRANATTIINTPSVRALGAATAGAIARAEANLANTPAPSRVPPSLPLITPIDPAINVSPSS